MRTTAKILLAALTVIIVSRAASAANDTIRISISPAKQDVGYSLVTANEGEPNVRHVARYVAIPKGADIDISFSLRNEKTTNGLYIEPAQKTASDHDSEDMTAQENQGIYTKDEFFPEDIVTTERSALRNFDLLLVSVATEQYNPVRRQTRIFDEIEINISVSGDASREAVIEDDNLTAMMRGIVENPGFLDVAGDTVIPSRREGCNYLIVIPDESFRVWADSLRNFREEQGIITKIVTMSDIGHNWHDTLKARFKYICDNWSPSPEAILLLGDYNYASPADGISTYTGYDHPEGHAFEPYFSDNQLVDFNSDDISDIVIARMPASNADEARVMVEKTIRYEREPSANPDYYRHPVTAMGYDKGRWFQLCTEILAGYMDAHGKSSVRINAIHEGVPDSVWSTAQNTDLVMDQFGPAGLNYIPQTMSHLTDWDGDDTRITEAIENGSFIVAHRDHGTYETWGNPYFSTSCINALRNDDLTFVISANCQTGHFGHGNGYGDCFAERLLKCEHGAVAAIAASELSYSFVNDTYVWGVFDCLYPDFMPDYGPQDIDFQYPAFANLYGKIFLKKSSFPSNKKYVAITNRLFHYFGDAYLQLNSEMPQELHVSHPKTILPEHGYVTIEADDNTHIALSVDNQMIARGKTKNGKVTMFFIPQPEGTSVKVVATKQNHFRHESRISVTKNIGIDENQEAIVEIYPNPCSGKMCIKCDDICNIKVFNILGREMKNIEFSHSDKVDVDISDLSDGIYLVLINNHISSRIQKTK